ncbi:hypothetical protein FMEXI_960 [Fusarium mexicanum]|uniref:Uncharacterized protein n=1 Tax=Fusarium mexicanum TaxID=751941 RepID=A0A8H5JLD9_9HYPO|nr:hypothetical protein FMEXI_960 [Fusarium mexicanum]
MADVYFQDVTTEHNFKSRAANFNDGTPAFFSVAYLNKSGSSWSTQHLLICHVIATKKRDNCLPDFDTKEPLKLKPDLSEKAKSQIDSFINGPKKEDPAISKHYLVAQLILPISTVQKRQCLGCAAASYLSRHRHQRAGNVFPELNNPYPANGQIQQFINGPGDEDPAISKHYLVGKYGTNLREIWAALATVTAYKHKPATIIPSTTSNQSTSPSKRPRRSGPAPKYYSSDSDEPGMSCQDSNVSEYMEQYQHDKQKQPELVSTQETQTKHRTSQRKEPVAAKDLPPEDILALLITRVLNLISYCTQPFGFQLVVDFRTERQSMSLRVPGVDGPIVAIGDGGLTLKSDERKNGVMERELMVELLEANKGLSVEKTLLCDVR